MYLTAGILYFCYVHLTSCIPLFEHEDMNRDHTVVVFGFSGLRWDLLEHNEMSTLRQLGHLGVIAQRKIDSFQTETLPSFVTMTTGRYPEYHGMMSNKMKDLISGETFDVKNTDSKWWNNVDPIWVTNAKNGSSNALCYWPGSDVKFQSNNNTLYNCPHETFVDPFKTLTTKGDITEKVMPFEERLDQVRKWLQLKNDRPSFIGVYFEEPLFSVMKYGLNSSEAKKAFKKVNEVTKDMIDYLKQHKQFNRINFVVTGESGFTELEEQQAIYLEDYTNDKEIKSYDIIDDGPITMVYPHSEDKKQQLLKTWDGAHKHMKVYDGKNLTKDFHFTNANRTAPIIIVADERWRIYGSRVIDNKKAMMGFDGKYSSSHALFIAHGPAFKKNVLVNAIGNVDVYGMLCKALKIKPHLHDGKATTIKMIMKAEETWYIKIVNKVTSSRTGLTIAVIIAMILLFIALYLIICSIYKTVGWCACPKKPLKINILSPKKKNKEKGGQHLLSEDELSSDVSDTDDDLGNDGKYTRR